MQMLRNVHPVTEIQVSANMAEVRARVDFKVGAKSNIDAEILSFHGLQSDKEHVAVIFKSADTTQEAPACAYALGVFNGRCFPFVSL